MTYQHRQQYGLGSFIKKAVKKIGRGAKKVYKSKLGKLALGAAAAYGLNRWGLPGSGAGKNWWSKAMGTGPGKFLSTSIMGKPTGQMAAGQTGARSGGLWNWIKGNPGKAAMIGAGTVGSIMPFMAGNEDEIIEEGWENTPESIAKIRQMAKDRHPSLAFMPSSDYVQEGFFTGAKDGGIIGLANGGPAEAQAEQMLKMEYQKYRNQGGTMSYQQFKMAVLQQAQSQGPMAQGQSQMGQPQMAAQGGRIGYQGGELVEDASMVEETPTGMMAENVEEVQGEPTREQLEALAMEIFQLRLEELDEEQLMVVYQAAMEQQPEAMAMQEEDIQFNPQMAQPQMAAKGGLMSLGGMEKDYRQEGGFVPIGGKEKADDVPARLSKNEFVFTADAVRNAGGGDIDQGAEVMENMMNHLEAGGEISEESQGGGGEMISEEEIIEEPNGAQEMCDQQQMLQSRMG